jgi:type IV pilus assembly protein PilX
MLIRRGLGPVMKRREQGFVLVVILLLLVAIGILGLMNSSNALLQTKMARAEREYQGAFAAAESALSDAERELMGGIRTNPNGGAGSVLLSAKLAGGSEFYSLAGSCDASGTLTASQAGVGLGLYDMSNCPSAWWLKQTFTSANSVSLGGITGASYPTSSAGFLLGSSRAPSYIIDVLTDNFPKQNADPNDVARVFRVTARGVGSTDDTEVLLQSTIRRID